MKRAPKADLSNMNYAALGLSDSAATIARLQARVAELEAGLHLIADDIGELATESGRYHLCDTTIQAVRAALKATP